MPYCIASAARLSACRNPEHQSLDIDITEQAIPRAVAVHHEGDRQTLADFVDVAGVYPAGRLDYDSEGLLLLTDNGALQAHIAAPRAKTSKYYWAQVEGPQSLDIAARLAHGVTLKDGPARAHSACVISEPDALWDRAPPVRFRKSVPDHWLNIELREGRNRQVRRMTAAAGAPTLRLIRHRIGPWTLEGLAPGHYRSIDDDAAFSALRGAQHA